MKKNVWIMNHYATHTLIDAGGRHYFFSKYLKQKGYSPVVFCANMLNNNPKEQYRKTSKLYEIEMAEAIETPYVLVKVTPYYGNGFARVRNMYSFYRNLKKTAKEYAKLYGKPDVIYASSVHPLTLVAGIQLAKKFGVKCVCEVRDLWPEAIVTYSKRITKKSPIAKMMYAGEKWIYKKADAVIFTQEGGPDYVREQKWDDGHGGPIKNDKLFHINNGVDLEIFDNNRLSHPYSDVDLDNPDIYKVVYAGSIRRINNLGLIVDAAKLITNPKIKFIIFGDGYELPMLQERLLNEGITNVVFKGRVNKQFIPAVDSKADLNLVHWEMSPLVRVGESYNKSFEYFAAGKPVFYTIRPGYSIVEKYHCGCLTEGFEPEDIARGIQAMAEMSDEEKQMMSINARKTAEVYDFKNLTAKLIDIIENKV